MLNSISLLRRKTHCQTYHTHMQAGSLDTCFNVGNNDNQSTEEVQSEKQGEVVGNLKEEPDARGVEVKPEPGRKRS
jgi:hypothetical protein